ncbi:hypothetical protein [Cellulophaga baltica]|uniref:hypothetical protein n=1 Tax=Cellulophaga baltica TaxID=76594 RepID=UPI0003F9274E|nr:hypothetical protein [Cellulophaga baltica]AIY14300.1 hypothetical protein M667_14485 [Cellulophaga baltica NN016038]
MKNKFFLISICFLFTTANFSQNKKEVETYLNTLFQILEEKKTEEFYASLYPKLKEQIPVAQVNSFLGELHSNPNFKTEVKNFKTLAIGNLVTDAENAYALVDYISETHIEFTEEATQKLIAKGTSHFKKLYGERYSYDSDKKIIVTNKDFKILMVYEDQQWSHIPGVLKLKPYLNFCIKDEILTRLFAEE